MAFRDENPNLPGADRVAMAFVNMHSPDLRILATHRLVSGLPAERLAEFLTCRGSRFQGAGDRFRRAAQAGMGGKRHRRVRLSARRLAIKLYLLEESDASGELDIRILHDLLLGKALGISEEAVRNEQFIRYMRGIDAAVDAARTGAAQIAFLLKPTSVQQVADTSFGGGVMPQKSTDFYPKLLSGLTIYKLDR